MYKPFMLPATFVNIVVSMLLEDVLKFLLIFFPLLFGFATAINALLQVQTPGPSRGLRVVPC